jgi:ribosomal protein L37AE/L43A
MRNSTMDLRCIECANDLCNKIMVTRLGDFDVWYCDDCNVYYEKQELYRMICTA